MSFTGAMMNPLSPATDVECLVQCASELCDNIVQSWKDRESTIDWASFADLTYWRFCRFASHSSGRLIELGADEKALEDFHAVLDRFIQVTEDMQDELQRNPASDRDHADKIQRASIHCKARREWFDNQIQQLQEFESKTRPLSWKLAIMSGPAASEG